jgi:hypothetical protein
MVLRVSSAAACVYPALRKHVALAQRTCCTTTNIRAVFELCAKTYDFVVFDKIRGGVYWIKAPKNALF